jgi:hypothetical protein
LWRWGELNPLAKDESQMTLHRIVIFMITQKSRFESRCVKNKTKAYRL